MQWAALALLVLGILLLIANGLSLLMGAPYLPTMKKQRKDALDLLEFKPGQVIVDLGSGDGSLLILAARRGLKVVGYEINPFLWLVSWLRTRRYGRQVKIKFHSFWGIDLSYADGVFVFLITHRMEQLDKLLSSRVSKKPLKVVSHGFEIPGKKPLKKHGALFLYIYK